MALPGTSIFLFHLNPHSLVLLAFPKPMFVCLSGLRLERLENHHFFGKMSGKRLENNPKIDDFWLDFFSLTCGNPGRNRESKKES